MSYGVVIGDLAIRQDYKSLNFVAKGNSVATGSLSVFNFTTQKNAHPVIFIKPINTNSPVAPHVLLKKSPTEWAAYFVGDVTAYVFTELARDASGGYGIEIYNDFGNLFYDSETIPAKFIKTVTVGAIAPNRNSSVIPLNSAATKAFNLHGNRMSISMNFSLKKIYVWRDSVVLGNNGYFMISKLYLEKQWSSGETIDDYIAKAGNICNRFPVSLSFIDVGGL